MAALVPAAPYTLITIVVVFVSEEPTEETILNNTLTHLASGVLVGVGDGITRFVQTRDYARQPLTPNERDQDPRERYQSFKRLSQRRLGLLDAAFASDPVFYMRFNPSVSMVYQLEKFYRKAIVESEGRILHYW